MKGKSESARVPVFVIQVVLIRAVRLNTSQKTKPVKNECKGGNDNTQREGRADGTRKAVMVTKGDSPAMT